MIDHPVDFCRDLIGTTPTVRPTSLHRNLAPLTLTTDLHLKGGRRIKVVEQVLILGD